MLDQTLDCLIATDEGARPLYAVRPAGLDALLNSLPPAQAGYLRDSLFAAKPNELRLLPGDNGVSGAVLGLGTDRSPFGFGGLATGLPAGTSWRLEPGDHDTDAATLGFCLGAYRYTGVKPAERPTARLVARGGQETARSQAAATWMVRDLINTPANLLGPVELAELAASLAQRHGAEAAICEGDALEAAYPTVAAVGRGSARPPRVATFHWRGSSAVASAPLISLCGKGVCFDTGGYDLKPSSAMLRMKKDMGGAAAILGLARLIMEADLPVRMETRIGCVENSVSGTAMRPLDVIRTRAGLSVEVGNTDAEGRLVLCDLLTDACDAAPALLIDCATLTGAARVALGPDVPALFCNDDADAEDLVRSCNKSFDPVWRLPLWDAYDDWLKSPVADLNNVSTRPFAGSIVAALFLQRFVKARTRWVHVDLYAWNDSPRPGRPEGGEAQSMRGIFTMLHNRYAGR
jgi:leucyl aminopeptidase